MSYTFKSVIFDLDGVITKTARIHGLAWKETFDKYLKVREERDGEPFKEFTHEEDYLPYVDGKPRYEGVQSFLASRGIDIPLGEPTDAPDVETACGIGNMKNEVFRAILQRDGADIFESTIIFAKALKNAGVRIGIASSSKNCKIILESAGLTELFETRVDGEVSADLGLKGKPEGDIFVAAARNLDTAPCESVVIEDATSGVAAGRNGGFGLVIGVAREGNIQALCDNGADCVVEDLAAMDADWIETWFNRRPTPLDKAAETPSSLAREGITIHPCYARKGLGSFITPGKRAIFFLDYDGTLTPIVDRPDLAVLSDAMRDGLERLIKKQMVSIVSGRMRDDVQNLVRIEEIFYAGSHGCDIVGPGFAMVHPAIKELIPTVDHMIRQFKEELGSIEGVLVEEKKFSVAVHYRLVDEKAHLSHIQAVVERVVSENPAFRLMSGKKVFEILPDIDWDKGKAIRWILEALDISWSDASVIYIGDDVTDEYAFRALRTRGTSILVCDEPRSSHADFQVFSIDAVKQLFEDVIRLS